MEELFETKTELQEEKTADELSENRVFEGEQAEGTEDSTEKKVTEGKKDTLNPYEEVILAEMKRRATDGDELMASALQSADKNIHDCFGYVKWNAQKKAVNGCAMIADADVYSWAHHYYTEPKDVIDAEMKPKVAPKQTTIPTTTAKSAEKADSKADKKGKGKKVTYSNPLLSSVSKKGKKGAEKKPVEKERTIRRKGEEVKIVEWTLF